MMQFEYKEIRSDSNSLSMLIDCYECFGWQIDTNVPQTRKSVTLKRDRKIINKVELTRLQRNFEACLEDIETLEQSKSRSSKVVSLTVGIIGTAFMAGSVFAVTNDPPIIWLCIVLAIPAFIGCTLPWFIFKSMLQRKTKSVNELIEQKYDEIYNVCEKGNILIN